MTRKEKLLNKRHIDILYNDFWEIYYNLPNNNFIIGDTFIWRIKQLHYIGKATLSRLLIAIKWTVNNLDLYIYYVKYFYKDKYPYIDVFYLNDNTKKRLCEYKIVKDKVLIVDEATTENIKLKSKEVNPNADAKE